MGFEKATRYREVPAPVLPAEWQYTPLGEQPITGDVLLTKLGLPIYVGRGLRIASVFLKEWSARNDFVVGKHTGEIASPVLLTAQYRQGFDRSATLEYAGMTEATACLCTGNLAALVARATQLGVRSEYLDRPTALRYDLAQRSLVQEMVNRYEKEPVEAAVTAVQIFNNHYHASKRDLLGQQAIDLGRALANRMDLWVYATPEYHAQATQGL